MLNELYDLALSLKTAGVSMMSWHRHFKPCPQGATTYLALIDDEAVVCGLEPISDPERIGSIRKWEVENGVSFPSFNVPPLYEPEDAKTKEQAVKFRKSLASKSPPDAQTIVAGIQDLVRKSASLWGEKEADRIEKCVTRHAAAVAASLGPPPPEFCAICELIARAGRLTATDLHRQLEGLLTRQASMTSENAAQWFDFLFFCRGKTPNKVSLVLELADRSQFAYPANNAAVQAWMNSRFESASMPASAAVPVSDAYGNSATELDETFPAVRLPILGNVILRSMSSESPCQKRYGAADSKSCPVGQPTRRQMKMALEWIGHPERQSKTWSDVTALNGVASVLFAYPSQRQDVAPELAGLLVGLDDETDPDGARFEACAKRVTQTLRGSTSECIAEVRVFVLSKPDGHRTKVIHSGRYSVTRLLQSAEAWQRDARNTPPLKIRQFGPAKGDKPTWADPLVPFPAELVACLNTVWERAGTHAEQVRSFGIGEGLGLLLEEGPVLLGIATRSVHGVIDSTLSLLRALGQAQHRGLVHPLGKKLARFPLLLPSILGLLLAKLGRKKGEYMKGPPFLVGRLLSLADQIHNQYCYGVRKGQVPPQLVGNALMATALEQPTKALSMLSQRILPYQAWARTVQGGDDVRLTKYLLGEIGRVTAELKEFELPTTCTDGDKAEMLLGYLAWADKEKDTTAVPS